MAIFAIGDVQGCHFSFLDLLRKIKFKPDRDELIFVGDLVNRGQNSHLFSLWLECARMITRVPLECAVREVWNEGVLPVPCGSFLDSGIVRTGHDFICYYTSCIASSSKSINHLIVCSSHKGSLSVQPLDVNTCD